MPYRPPNDQVLLVMQELGFERLQAIRHLQALHKAQEIARINHTYNAGSTPYAGPAHAEPRQTLASIGRPDSNINPAGGQNSSSDNGPNNENK